MMAKPMFEEDGAVADHGSNTPGPSERHAPVMLNEAVTALSVRDGGLYLDATFGAGGYTRAILGEADCRVLALDRDLTVRAVAEAVRAANPAHFTFANVRFSAMEETAALAGFDGLDGVVMDIGVSSMQLDQAERGFSFRADGPLDMRMGDQGPTAADAVAQLTQDELADVLFLYGDER